MENIYLKVARSGPVNPDMALATITGTQGSTPQKPGSSALFDWSGLIAGTVGGGVLEGKVQKIALDSIASKRPVYSSFTLEEGAPDGEDALCGGRISVLIDPGLLNHMHVYKALEKSFVSRTPGILISLVKVEEGDKLVVERYWATKDDFGSVPPELKSLVEPEITSLVSHSSQRDFRELKLPRGDEKHARFLFLEPVIPPLRLIIAGAGHIGRSLVQIGKILGFETTVIDDRPEFANYENIPDADNIITGEIGQAIREIKKGSDAYIVIVTRGHRDDAGALRSCIGSDAAYIGMIGSKTKVELMRRDFLSNRWATGEEWGRIYSPVGLDIGSKTVEEIAVSIAAQLVQIKNRK